MAATANDEGQLAAKRGEDAATSNLHHTEERVPLQSQGGILVGLLLLWVCSCEHSSPYSYSSRALL